MDILSTIINRIQGKSKVEKPEESDFYRYFESELTAIRDTIGFAVGRLRVLQEETGGSAAADKESRQSELVEIKGLFSDAVDRLKKLERSVKGSVYRKPGDRGETSPLTRGKGLTVSSLTVSFTTSPLTKGKGLTVSSLTVSFTTSPLTRGKGP